jgi:hypothetical protein
MATSASAALSIAGSEPRTYSSLLLESLALRHQIAVLKRSRTRRPCFRFIARLFWFFAKSIPNVPMSISPPSFSNSF